MSPQSSSAEANLIDGGGKHGLDLTFRAKLLLSMCGLVFLTGALIITVADLRYRATTQTLADSLFREVSRHGVTQTKNFVQRAAPVAESLRQLANQGLALDNLDHLAPQLLAFLNGNPGMTWVLYGDESGDYTGATRTHAGHIHIERTHIVNGRTHLTEYEVQSDGSWKIFKQDDDRGYDPRKRPFYILAKEKGKLAWSAPYIFFTQGVAGISCVDPVYNASGQLRGVFSVEFDLNALSEFVGELSISQHSRVFLFTPDQTLLAHANERNLEGKGVKGQGRLLTLADTGDPLVDAFRQHLRPEYVSSSGGDGYHFFEFDHAGVDYLASTTVFPIGDGQTWVVGAIAPQSDFLAEVWRTRWWSSSAAAASLCIAALVAAMLARRISRPVNSLIGFMRRVGEGDLDAQAEFQGGGREFRLLSAALNRMIGDLRERMQLRHSLQLAMEVQKSLLPANDPISPFLDIAGHSEYCDETGGDYYDFIDISTLSSSSILVAMGDVTGHGIAAALLMATARAVLHCRALDKPGLGSLMTRANQVLAADNRHERFMTLALLEIDGRSATVRWTSAGQDPAIVYEPGTGKFHELEGADLPLGVAEDVKYEDFHSDPFMPGSVLMIGTDGVWEMFNEKHEQYGKDRLRDVMRANHALPAKQIVAALKADLAAYRGSYTPQDDVTFVIVKFLQPATP